MATVVAMSAPWRELVILALTTLAYVTSQPEWRRLNGFTFGPILEIVAIFLGIFLTIEPALELLRRHGNQLGVREPLGFFWSTGVLSAALDNVPTYLAFLALAQGLGMTAEVVGVPHAILAGISLGAVAFGALTYIGNAPNFMVRAIAVEAGVVMPAFTGYLAYSLPVLLPLFSLVGAVFLMR